jgi:DNA-directed RNA polymerase specialized sigma24 family protein
MSRFDEASVRERCSRCGHVAGGGGWGCRLLAERALKPLLGHSWCWVLPMVRETTTEYLRRRFRRAMPEEDAAQAVLLDLMQVRGETLPGDPAALRRWLLGVVPRRAVDFLRREGLAPRVRCGACVHVRDRSPAVCGLEAVRDPATGDLVPHPHHGRAVGSEADPRGLDPPCRRFRVAPPPEPLGPVEPEAAGDPGAVEVVDLLERLAREDLRAAVVVRRRFLGGDDIEAIAADLGLKRRMTYLLAERGIAILRRLAGEE